MEHCCDDTDRVNRITRRKTCLIFTLTLLTIAVTGPVSNLGVHSERPATNTLGQYTALKLKQCLNNVQNTIHTS